MACLFLLRDDRPDETAALLARARTALARQGFDRLTERVLPGWRMLHAAPLLGGGAALVSRGRDVLAVAGTMMVGGHVGDAALAAALAAGPALAHGRIGGQFVALMHREGRSTLFGDALAAFQLFCDADRRIFSTSLLAAAACLPSVRLNAQAVYEYAFNIVPVGNDTILSDLTLLPPDTMVELDSQGAVFRAVPRARTAELDPAISLAERVARSRDRLMSVVEAHVAAFGDAIHCPLSGGFDSRLVLAALRAAGARPRVYVYGDPDSSDVRIARAIGAAEGFAVAHLDKAAFDCGDRDQLAETVAANFQAADALPTFGNIFGCGNEAARNARHTGGALAVSGGAGEIYRDFFRLPDAPAPAEAVVRAFFSRFDARDTTALFDAHSFRRHIRDAVLDALDVPGETGPLPRALIEQAYPRVRCRALFGRELSLEARLSPYLMPFLDPDVIADAMTLPLPLKQAGRFQSMLIAAIDPALARHPSSYGHAFDGPPSAAHRRSEWVSRHRPLWLRERSYAIQRRMGTMDDDHGTLDRTALAAVMDMSLPLMRRYFHVDRITDRGLWRRIAALEYFAQYLGSALALPAPTLRGAPAEPPAERFDAAVHIA